MAAKTELVNSLQSAKKDKEIHTSNSGNECYSTYINLIIFFLETTSNLHE
jgi:hypothetical protein